MHCVMSFIYSIIFFLHILLPTTILQVLSRSACEAMKLYGISGSSATQTFLLFMDRFFDMMNVRSKGEHVHTRKTDLRPYTSANDERLRVYIILHVSD